MTMKRFDGLRAVSVIFVILTYIEIYGIAANAGVLSDTLAPIISGTTGVQIFFVLSGFLITSLLIHKHSAFGSISLKNFYIRRASDLAALFSVPRTHAFDRPIRVGCREHAFLYLCSLLEHQLHRARILFLGPRANLVAFSWRAFLHPLACGSFLPLPLQLSPGDDPPWNRCCR